MSLMITIMWLTEKGFSVSFHQGDSKSDTVVTITHGLSSVTKVLSTHKLFDAFNSDCYASKILKEMAVNL